MRYKMLWSVGRRVKSGMGCVSWNWTIKYDKSDGKKSDGPQITCWIVRYFICNWRNFFFCQKPRWVPIFFYISRSFLVHLVSDMCVGNWNVKLLKVPNFTGQWPLPAHWISHWTDLGHGLHECIVCRYTECYLLVLIQPFLIVLFQCIYSVGRRFLNETMLSGKFYRQVSTLW